jgi:5-methylcytosine-specific restriction endonuclease McrA
MRRAVILRDGGCAFPGCGRPARWCQAHHIWHWSHGGPTALDNLVLLCAHHHNVVHHHGWQVHLDTNRLPVFTPPPWIDPDQTPRTAWRPPAHLLL